MLFSNNETNNRYNKIVDHVPFNVHSLMQSEETYN